MMNASEAKELLRAVDRVLPSISTYLRDMLKKEKLSPEAEALRARYDSVLMSLERISSSELLPPPVPRSVLRKSMGDSPGLPPVNRARVSSLHRSRTDSDIEILSPQPGMLAGDGLEVIPEQPDQILDLSGPLLRRDDKFRWHRSFCRISPTEKSLLVYESPEETQCLYTLQLEGAKVVFNPEDSDRENCFILTLSSVDLQQTPTSTTGLYHMERYFAAYSEPEFKQWKVTLEGLLSTSRRTNTLSILSTGDSFFETTGDMDRNGLPPPPPPLPGMLFLDNGDEDHFSDGTIYEDIDELVQQFDLTMKATVQAMQQMSPKKVKKKKKREFFGGSIGKSSGMKIMEEKRTQLESGEQHKGYLHKRSGGGSWKKRFCVLKGSIFSYSKSPDDPQNHEYILLRAELKMVKDSKKPHAFQLACRGIPEVIFAAADEQELLQWFTKLENATKRILKLSSLVEDTPPNPVAPALPEGIYNVPRSLLAEGYYNTPSSLRQSAPVTPSDAIAPPPPPPHHSIYDVPRNTMEGDAMSPMAVTSAQGHQFYMSGNPFDLYDVPRSAANDSSPPEDEVIYDYPLDLDLGDMEIYDYPPDASELGLAPEDTPKSDTPPGGSNRDSGSNVSNEYPTSDSPHTHTPISSVGSGSNRQSTAGSLGSLEDVSWSTSSGTTLSNGLPQGSDQLESLETFLESISNSRPPSSVGIHPTAAEFGQCTIKGTLYRKERMRSWIKSYCLIRNSFFECHKNSNISNGSKPLIKLFLPGTKISLVQDSKRQWAFQLKHPRREGVLLFAAESETDCLQWMEAFDAAVVIQVSKVDDVEQIRVNDSALITKWNSLERGLGEPTNGRSEEDIPDSVKRRSLRMSWGKNKRKPMQRDSKSSSTLTSGLRTASTELLNDIPMQQNPSFDAIQRSTSLDPMPYPSEDNPVGPHISSTSHRAVSPVGGTLFQGYLRVKQRPEEKGTRCWCVLEDLMLKCHTSQRNNAVLHQVSLKGSTITQADSEAKKKHTFRVWNSETRQCYYFSAYDESEYQSWFSEVTEGADQLAAEVSKKMAGKAGSSPVFYFSREGRIRSNSGSLKRTSGSVNSLDHSDGDSGSIASSGLHGALVAFQGQLKKRVDKNSWSSYYCQVKESHLLLFLNSGDQAPTNSLPLRDCTLERINLPSYEVERFAFTITIQASTHTFAAPSDQTLHGWLQAIQGCINKVTTPASTPTTRMRKLKSSSRKEKTRSEIFSPSMVVPKPNPPPAASTMRVKGRSPPSVFNTTESEIVSYVPASSLTNPIHSGYVEVQLDTAVWVRYWCVIHKNSLYIYANKDSKSTVRTVILPGHEVQTLGATSKKTFAIALVHSGLQLVCLAPTDPIDMRKWFMALEHATKTDGTEQPSTGPTSQTSTEKRSTDPSADTREVISPEEFTAKQLAIIGQYEKKIRRTQKVSRMTEQNLDGQRAGMQQLKDMFNSHMGKLQEKAEAGDPLAQKKLQELKVKLHQIDKVLPYLQKYVQVNQQAEMQTMAILKESCTEEINKLKTKYRLSKPVASITQPSFSTLPLTRQEKLKVSSSKINSLTRPKKSRKSRKLSSEDQTHSTLERRHSVPNEAPTTPSRISPLPALPNTSDLPQHTTDQPARQSSASSQQQTPVFVPTPSPPPISSPSLPTDAYEEPQYAVLGYLPKATKPRPEPEDKPMYAELTLHESPSLSTKFSDQSTVNYSEVSISPAPPVNKSSEDMEISRVTELDQVQPSPTHKTASICQPQPSPSRPQPPPVASKPSRILKSQLSDAPSYPPPPPPPPPLAPIQPSPEHSSNAPTMTNGPQKGTEDLKNEVNWSEAGEQNTVLPSRLLSHENQTMTEISHTKRTGMPSIAQRMKAFQQQ